MKKSLLFASLIAVSMLAGCGGTKVELVEGMTAASASKVENKIEERISDVEKDLPMNMEGFEIGIAIHQMSHQKVVANTKWGEMPLTQERVSRLIEVLDSKDFEHEAIYLGILKRWEKGDFSGVVIEHNTIWNLQGGTVGEATHRFTHDEEMIYIQDHFDVKTN